MLKGLAVGVETWMGRGLEVKAVLVVKDNPTPATCNQEGGEGECKAPWTHFTGGWASGRWLLPVPGSSQVWPRLPCGPSLCLPLPGLVCISVRQEPGLHKGLSGHLCPAWLGEEVSRRGTYTSPQGT